MTFYKTTFTIDVFSDEPLGDCLSLEKIDYLLSEGPGVGGNFTSKEVEITGKEMVAELYKARQRSQLLQPRR